MQKTSRLLVLFFITALLWPGSSEAMFANLKNAISHSFVYAASFLNSTSKTATIQKTIKPFGKSEKKKAFRALVARENLMSGIIDYDENYGITQAIYDNGMSTHLETLIIFFQRLFRSIVKKDIQNKQPYTVDLGLTVADDGTILMETMPMDLKEKWQQIADGTKNIKGSVTVEQLIDICDRKTIPTITDIKILELLKQTLYLKKTNPTKNSDCLFPLISIVSGAELEKKIGPGFEGCYSGEENKIYIQDTHFTASDGELILHEFGHTRQFRNAGTKKIYGALPITTLPLPLAIKDAVEYDADHEMLYTHPDKLFLLEKLHKLIDYNRPFPYPPAPSLYYKLAAYLNKRGYHIVTEGSSLSHWARWAINKFFWEKCTTASAAYSGSEQEQTESAILEGGKTMFELGKRIANAPTDMSQTQEAIALRKKAEAGIKKE